MRKLLFLLLPLLYQAAHAQIDLPLASPQASVTQTIGLTNITINYSRPSTKGRAIWGKLVPYNEVWRTGANNCTQISFNTEVQLGNVRVPAGRYSLFTIPTAGEWTVIINRNTSLWGSFGYNQSEDVCRFTVKPIAGEYTETFTIDFSNLKDNSATIDVRWDELILRIPVQVEVQNRVKENIVRAVDGTWRTYATAASYYLDSNQELPTALQYIDKSIVLQEDTWNYFLKSRLLAKTGDYRGAVTAAEKSLLLAKATQNDFYIKANETNLAEWRLKVPTEERQPNSNGQPSKRR